MFDKNTKQITNHILMIRPANFSYNTETAESNAFQSSADSLSKDEIQELALAEFDAFVEKLRAYSVNVIVVEDTPTPAKPDSIFPNNWVSFHESGIVVTYPLMAEVRRKERRKDIIEDLKKDFIVDKEYSFEAYEEKDQFLEGTGSMILDRQNKIAYACLGPRTNIKVMEKFAVLSNYQKVIFHATDENDLPIYHTNVIMSVCETFAIICLDCIKSEVERNMIIKQLEATGKKIIEITMDQVKAYAGNMLQVAQADGKGLVIMSEQAFRSLEPEQIKMITSESDFLYGTIPTIEKIGGGSVRCMMAEVFLPKKPAEM